CDKRASPPQLAAVGIKHEILELKGQWFPQPFSNRLSFMPQKSRASQYKIDAISKPGNRIAATLPAQSLGGTIMSATTTLTSTILADFTRARDSQITFSVTHGWSAFWRGRPWLAGGRIGETSSGVGSSRFWIGWVTKHGDKCARSTCRD